MKYITRFYFTTKVLSYYPTRELPFNINIGKEKKTLTTGINKSPMMPVANENKKMLEHRGALVTVLSSQCSNK
ncbi:MAG: hypothetical protein ACLS4S_06425 [Bacteroides nordii]